MSIARLLEAWIRASYAAIDRDIDKFHKSISPVVAVFVSAVRLSSYADKQAFHPSLTIEWLGQLYSSRLSLGDSVGKTRNLGLPAFYV